MKLNCRPNSKLIFDKSEYIRKYPKECKSGRRNQCGRSTSKRNGTSIALLERHSAYPRAINPAHSYTLSVGCVQRSNGVFAGWASFAETLGSRREPKTSRLRCEMEEKYDSRCDRLLEPQSLRDEIRNRAYELYEQRGRQPGKALEDWLMAESEIKDCQRWTPCRSEML